MLHSSSGPNLLTPELRKAKNRDRHNKVLSSLLHNCIIFISYPSSLGIIWYQILQYSLFQISYIALPFFYSKMPPSPFSYFCFKFYFLSCYNLSPFHIFTIAPLSSLSKPLVIVIIHLTFFLPFLKYPYSLSTFISLCSQAVYNVFVVTVLQSYF